MPSPVGHALGGLIVHALSARKEELGNAKRAILLASLAVAPDLDLLFKYVDGVGHHRAETHSLGAALAAGLAVALVARLARRERALWLGLAACGAWFSHVVLDLLGADSHPPFGLMALWPFDHGYYVSPLPLFMDIGRTLRWTTVWQNAAAAAWEAVVLLPVLLAVLRLRERRS